jgi:hypothetical protein
MSTPNDSHGTQQNDIQFDQAEFATETEAVQQDVTRCTACKLPIPDVYYEAGGKIVCAPCRDKIEAMFHSGPRLARVFKALFFGTIGAAIGAFLYYAIMRITGLNIGLIAIVVGLLVGGAVKAGSENRGGRFYQFLAVFLTYSAIVAMYVPDMIEGIKKGLEKAGEAKVVKVVGKQATPKPEADPKAVNNENPAPAQPAVQPPQVDKKTPSLARVLAAIAVILAMLIGFAYSIPVQIAIGSPISGLIFGFALWEAWKINRRVQLAFSGPFRLGAVNAGDQAFEPGGRR